MHNDYDYDYYEYNQEHDRLDCHDWDIIGYPSEYVLGDDFYIGDDDLDERWLPIRGYEGRYWISDHGRVWSVSKRKIMTDQPGNEYGHREVKLVDDAGEKQHHYIQILVANAFVPGKFEGAQALHNYPDPEDNYARNLHWGTQRDNMRECIEQGRFRFFTEEDHRRALEKRSKPLRAKNLKTGVILDFPSQSEASRRLNIDQTSIGSAIRGERTHVGNWIFADAEEDFPDISGINLNRHRKNPPIIASNLETGEEIEFRGLTRAAEKLGLSIASVSLVLSGKQKAAKGWTFYYLDEEEYDE